MELAKRLAEQVFGWGRAAEGEASSAEEDLPQPPQKVIRSISEGSTEAGQPFSRCTSDGASHQHEDAGEGSKPMLFTPGEPCEQVISVARDGTASFVPPAFPRQEGGEDGGCCQGYQLSDNTWLEAEGGDTRVIFVEPTGAAYVRHAFAQPPPCGQRSPVGAGDGGARALHPLGTQPAAAAARRTARSMPKSIPRRPSLKRLSANLFEHGVSA